MSDSVWVLATRAGDLATLVRVAAPLGPVTVVAVGDRQLADAAATAGPHAVAWLDPGASAVEAVAPAVAAAAAAGGVRRVVAAIDPSTRALAGAVAPAIGAAVLSEVRGLALDGEAVAVERLALDGAVVQSLSVDGAVVALVRAQEEDEPPASDPAPVEVLEPERPASPVRIVERREAGGTAGIKGADRVVGIGRGFRSKDDVALAEDLARALGAEVGCTMPVADDLRWLPKETYIGRSGQQISPRLYVAIGISGATQHLEGVQGAKTVVAINSDPDAPIFGRADLGIVGDLYDVVPALAAALD